MKVILVNGSPHEKGCTYTALDEVAKTLREEGVEAVHFWIGNQAVRGCIGCCRCDDLHRCVFDDDKVNEFLKLGDKVKVRVLAVPPDGKINLSIKKAEEAPARPNNRPMNGGRPGGSRPNNGGAPRAARPNRPAQPAGQVSGPSGDAAFEDRLKQFMQESDSRMAGNRLYNDRSRGRRRGGGNGRG